MQKDVYTFKNESTKCYNKFFIFTMTLVDSKQVSRVQQFLNASILNFKVYHRSKPAKIERKYPRILLKLFLRVSLEGSYSFLSKNIINRSIHK